MRNLVDPADDPSVDDGHRRARILRALATSVAEKGYQATTISDIARKARVSKTVVYAHFRDKEQCLLELYTRSTDHVPEVAWTAMVEVQAAGRAGLALRRVVIDRYADLITAFATELAAEHPEEIRSLSRQVVVAAVGGINELILARVELGEAARLHEDADVAAAVVIGLLECR